MKKILILVICFLVVSCSKEALQKVPGLDPNDHRVEQKDNVGGEGTTNNY